MLNLNVSPTNLMARSLYEKSNLRVGDSLAKLSSGTLSSSNSPSGTAITENIKSSTRAKSTTQQNINEGLSLIQIANQGITNIYDILVRTKELALRSANDTIDDSARANIEKEFSQLVDEIERIAKTTKYKGVSLLDGSVKTMPFQIGEGNDETSRIVIKLEDFRVDWEGVFPLNMSNLKDSNYAKTTLDILERHLQRLTVMRSMLGGYQSRLRAAYDTIERESIESLAQASRIKDVDVASEQAELLKGQIGQKAAESFLTHSTNDAKRVLKLL